MIHHHFYMVEATLYFDDIMERAFMLGDPFKYVHFFRM